MNLFAWLRDGVRNAIVSGFRLAIGDIEEEVEKRMAASALDREDQPALPSNGRKAIRSRA